MNKSRILIAILSSVILFAKAPLISVFTDEISYREAEKAVLAYCAALEEEGYRVNNHVGDWKDPESVREQILLDLSGKDMEGAVFIGDIPVPMILDAQHLTSAFKIDQDRFSDMQRIAVASDRFYDDPDLQFDFIARDENNPLLFYYSLSENSPQYIEKDFYSGRIFPPVHDERKYAMIADYLFRVAEQKKRGELLDTMLTFTGHGYHSESLSSWETHALMLREQFPHLYLPGGNVRHYYHTMSRDIKKIIMREMQDPQLDMAVFHAHGGYDAQYLMGYPPAATAKENAEEIRRFVRSKLRTAKRRGNYEEAKSYYLESYDIPEHWIADTFNEEKIREDSLYNALLDIYSADVRGMQPQAEVIIFDQCYNGQFFKEDYISGTYLFTGGTVVAGVANTVNVRQDIWANELLGLLRFGVPLGTWHRSRNYLESHIIGDPTWRFTPVSQAKLNAPGTRLLRSDDATLRSYGVYRLYRERGLAAEAELLKIYRRDPSANVRLQALKSLASLRTPAFRDLLKISINDPAELIRRFSANWMGKIGNIDYIPLLVERYTRDISERVVASAKSELDILLPNPGAESLLAAFTEHPDSDSTAVARLEYAKNRSNQWLYEDLIKTLKDGSESATKRISKIRTFRNYNFVPGIPELLALALNEEEDPAVRRAGIEALGWFTMNANYTDIIDALRPLKDSPEESVRKETEKSIKRLEYGANMVITP
ncbi:MAG: HEAT repeat domain-containing protein [Candidatus Marinimicrobia bacterium]|jgi:HEAT repeat protein|nr:HEAT repeat domain-containing protein [Candidatus Neomarinimicrobiota bacterium]MDD5710182.1 HEAT repeat domain-containing protein [Candidatus Neomarinimicrobiota bacterium]MDX9777605.1 HEAT repeat domain-containing protein [bacterium]